MRGVPAALSSAGGISLSVCGLTRRSPKTLSFSRHHVPSPACFSTNSSPGDSSASKPWLLVGLGNPGKSYQGTRHNVGFEMINAIAEAEGISVTNIHCKALLGKVVSDSLLQHISSSLFCLSTDLKVHCCC